MIVIDVKGNYAEFDGEKIPLNEIAFSIYDIGLMRADYVLQILRKHEGMANRFSIAEKLAKYKKI